ncbi:MAG TPA: hypothetical protein VHE35_26130 [Kofleriaceae bacterium]|nr:hypothetical protein [Kofleriaceae bacterium]
MTIAQLAPAASPDDVVVARVNGRPVWGSCVAAQARGRHVDARTALGDCVDLELGAQEAERRGLDEDPDVLEQAQQAMVARFVDRDFTAVYQKPSDLPSSFVDPIMKRNEWRLHRDEYRGSFYARVEADEKEVPRGSAADQEAERIAQAAYARLAGRHDLFRGDVEAALRAAAGPTVKLDFADFKPTTGDNVQHYYRDALFALHTIGEVSPPTRGPYGWDLVLWTTRLEPLDQTRDDVLAQLWKPMRQRFFLDWAAQAGKGHDVQLLADGPTTERLLGGSDAAVPPPPRTGP